MQWTDIVFIRPAQPAPVKRLGELGSVVPTPAIEVVLAVMVVDAVETLAPLRGLVAVGVENRVHVPAGPLTVRPDRMRRVNGFETVVERDGGRPHLGLHSAADEVLEVHGVQLAAREAGEGVDVSATLDVLEVFVVGFVVAWVCIAVEDRVHAWDEVPDFAAVRPFGFGGIPDGLEGDEVGFFADTPSEVVLVTLTRRYRSDGGLESSVVWLGAPDRLEAILCHSFLDRVVSVLEPLGIVAVGVWEVESLVTLPQVFPRSIARELRQRFEELVVVASESRIGLPVPDIVKFWMSFHEPLQRHELMPVHLPVGDFGKPAFHDALVPENADVLKLLRYGLLQKVLANLLVEQVGMVILDVDEQEDLILSTRKQRQLSDKGTDGLQIIVRVSVAFPCADQQSSPVVMLRLASILHRLDELLGHLFDGSGVHRNTGLRCPSILVVQHTLILQLAPTYCTPVRVCRRLLPVFGFSLVILSQTVRSVPVVSVKAFADVDTTRISVANSDIREPMRESRVRLDNILGTLIQALSAWTDA